jgi:hypothetical protein
VRHKKRRLGNIGEGKPRVERWVPIFLQNFSNKAPALGKLLSIPSPLIYLPSYYACTRELIHACLPTMVSRVIGLGKCKKKKRPVRAWVSGPAGPICIGARVCLAEHTLMPYPFYFTLFFYIYISSQTCFLIC